MGNKTLGIIFSAEFTHTFCKFRNCHTFRTQHNFYFFPYIHSSIIPLHWHFVKIIVYSWIIFIKNEIIRLFVKKEKLWKKGFTLAEVLITLGIIGIVAAMTLPVLTKKYKRYLVETKLKAAYSILSQALAISEAANGPATYWKTPDSSNGFNLNDYMMTYFSPYIKYIENGTKSWYFLIDNGNAPYLKLPNGIILYFHKGGGYDLIVDINGIDAPNKSGYDIFYFLLNINSTGFQKGFHPIKPAVIESRNMILSLCKTQPNYCGALIEYDGWIVKDDYPYNL